MANEYKRELNFTAHNTPLSVILAVVLINAASKGEVKDSKQSSHGYAYLSLQLKLMLFLMKLHQLCQGKNSTYRSN